MKKAAKIYFTSDVHGYLYPTTYADHTDQAVGLFKCASQFEKDGNTLIIDGGDMLQGSAYAYYCQSVEKSPRSIAQVMNACGYDFITLGNHDFNYGQDYLNDYLSHLDATCVCQNVEDENGKSLYPYAIKELENGIKVGIVGIVTDYVNVWEKPEHLEGMKVTAPLKAAKMALEALKPQVDLTVGVYHGGFEKDLSTGKMLSTTTENVAYKICETLDFDVLLTGHQHMHVEGQMINGTYVVQPTPNGTMYQALELVHDGDRWHITSKAEMASGTRDYTHLSALTDETESKVQEWLEEAVGHLDRELKPEDKVKMAKEGNAIATFLNQVQLYYSKAQISAVALANEVAGFNKEVKRRDIIATYPYPNTLVVFEITGDKLRQVMERSAAYFAIDELGKLVISDEFLKPKVEHYNYDFYAGVTYEIDATRPIGERIINLAYDGKLVEDADVFTICVNNYRASGAGGYEVYTTCKIASEINTEMVELIMAYFEAHEHVTVAM